MSMIGNGIRSILRNGVLLTGANWIETVLRAGYVVALTRYLGPEFYGIWTYAIAAYAFAIGLTGFGFETLLPLRLGTDRAQAGRILGASLLLRLVALGVAAAGLALYALLAEPRPAAALALVLVLPALLGRGVAVWGRAVFVGYESAGILTRLAAALRILEVAGGVLLLSSGAGLFAILALHSAAWVAEAALSLRIITGRLAAQPLRFDRAGAVALGRTGAVLGLAEALTNWLMSGPVLLFRRAEGDLAQVGQLGLVLQITMLFVMSLQPFLNAALPVLGRSAERADRRLASYGPATAALALLIGGAGAAVGFAFGETLTIAVFGPEFAAAGRLIGPSILVGALIVLPTGYGQLLVVRGRRWPAVAAGGAGTLVLIAALPAATAQSGLTGAFAATAAAWLVRAVVLIALALVLKRAAPGDVA